MAEAHSFSGSNDFQVRDTTFEFPLLNSNDAHSGLAPGLLDEFSLAIGEIEPVPSSKIHVHPLVTQVTMVLNGRLEFRIRDRSSPYPHSLQLAEHQEGLARPWEFHQLINNSVFACRFLDVVGPAYIFDIDDKGNLLYDDANFLDQTWEELGAINWMPTKLAQGNRSPSKSVL